MEAMAMPSLFQARKRKLQAQITKDEIKDVVFSIEPPKAVGLDGPALFYQKFWNIVVNRWNN